MTPIHESDIRKKLKLKASALSSRVVANFGDGSAIVRSSGKKIALNTTSMVEGVHYDLSYTTARELGHKAVAISLSSIAALGAKPLFMSLSAGLRQEQGDLFVGELFSGAIQLAKRFHVDLVAENTFPSPSFSSLSITVLGESGQKYFRPDGARPGDLLMVTGALGGSAAGLSLLKHLGRSDAATVEEALKAHVAPEPRNREALSLMKLGCVTALADIRDGLARDIHRLSDRSGVGALIDETSVPIVPWVEKAASLVSGTPLAWALFGAEDYELVFSIKPRSLQAVQQLFRRLEIPVALIGEIKPRDFGVKLKNRAGDVVPLLPKLWNHLARRSRLRC